jgi:UMF1 family MFS transporter
VTAIGTGGRSHRADHPRTIAAWCLYDWANSGFTTLVVTFVYATYFTRAMAPDEITGTAWWSRGITVSALLVALLSPIVGALADQGGLRRTLLAGTTTICIAASATLAFVAPGPPHAAVIALAVFVVGNVCYEVGQSLYNSFLPIIASPARIGRVSGYGWGMGYVGGLGCLVIALVALVQPDVPWFGVSKEAGFNIRAANLLVAGWFALFSVPFFVLAPREPRAGGRVDLGAAFRDLARLFREVRRYREAAKFLLAQLVYNDGLITIFAFGGIYAAGTFGMSTAEIIVFGIGLNVAAGAGAFAFGFVDDRIGGKATVMLSLAALTVATALAVWAPNRTWLWIAGMMVGVFAGPTQSASRSLMGRFVPEGRQGEFFGFFAFSGKFTSFMGPLLLGSATQVFQSQRVGVATIMVFFIAGSLLLSTVNEQRGIAAAAG